uniref:Uncharacterized protein n=1 Tax=Cacopsylla melanoneura TaxID=428564 RepID=A0A8D8LKZ0_9HEMI
MFSICSVFRQFRYNKKGVDIVVRSLSNIFLYPHHRTLEFISFCRHFFVDKTFSFEIFMQHSTFSYEIFVQHFSFSYEFSMQHFLTISYGVFTFRAKFDM